MKTDRIFSVGARGQRGVALAVVLILLLVVTLLGLAVLRNTLLDERMSANQRDRSLSFQAAEMALREGEEAIRSAGTNLIGFNCVTAGKPCPATPTNTYAANTSGCKPNDENCWQDATGKQSLEVGKAQYYIQYLGERLGEDLLSQNNSANSNQYGGGGGAPIEEVFRVSARSADPAVADDRSLVVLQSTVVRK